jgi:excisionase family DNA binding protein
MDRLLLRPAEVAETLGICRTKAYELISTGVIPSIRLGSSVRVPTDLLRAWIAAQSSEATHGPHDRRISQP